MTPPRAPLILYTDPEHRGLQLVIPLILFVTFWISYILLSVVLRVAFPAINSAVILSCLGAIPISLLIGGLSEALLKRVWHGGGRIEVDQEQIRLEHPDLQNVVINRQEPLNALWWKIPLKGYPRGGRERRMPEKNYCVAGQMQQEGQRLTFFCYAAPKQSAAWEKLADFIELDPADVYEPSSYRSRFSTPVRPEIPPDVVTARHGRHWLAERNRWTRGVELTVPDFEALLKESKTLEKV